MNEIIIIAIVTLVLIGGVTLILIPKPKKNKRIKKTQPIEVSEEFISTLVSFLGGISNLVTIDVLNNRLKIEVKDVKIVSVDDIFQIATKGVFVTGNNIKMLFEYESDLIKKQLEELLSKNK